MPPEIPSTTVTQVPDPLPEGVSLLDVREPVEWEHGHIEGALHVPLMQLPERRDEIPDGRVIVVCKVGGRSMQATRYLVQQGYDAVNLEGGMIDWAAAGRPMVSDTERSPEIV